MLFITEVAAEYVKNIFQYGLLTSDITGKYFLYLKYAKTTGEKSSEYKANEHNIKSIRDDEYIALSEIFPTSLYLKYATITGIPAITAEVIISRIKSTKNAKIILFAFNENNFFFQPNEKKYPAINANASSKIYPAAMFTSDKTKVLVIPPICKNKNNNANRTKNIFQIILLLLRLIFLNYHIHQNL